MKIVSYLRGEVRSFGVVIGGDQILDIPQCCGLRRISGVVPLTLDEALSRWAPSSVLIQECVGFATSREYGRAPGVVGFGDVRVLAPVGHPSKIIGIGLNYRDHCREQNIPPPAHPVLFSKYPSAIIGSGDVIRWDPSVTGKVDVEAELAVVIGTRVNKISPRDALEVVAGYTILNDVSARDLQYADRQWDRGKSLDTFCPMGPYLVTGEEVGDPGRLAIRCTVNGHVRQESNTSEMIFSVAELISFITQGITMEAGDVIATGTPSGVGHFRKPPVYLRDGDQVVVSIEKIGDLKNRAEIAPESPKVV
jgi:2-keto-4-pentenoate hydratase/2-oxohepta-3-ene-1,7-dioic acid hydratase in catechol pathway